MTTKEIKKITELTQEQIKKFPEYVNKWTKIGHSTDNSTIKNFKEDVIADIKKIYIKSKNTVPETFIFMDSPLAANYLINIIVQTGEYDIDDPKKMTIEYLRKEALRVCKESKDIKEIKSYNNDACYGQHDASILSFYEYFKNECGLEVCEDLEGFYSLAEKVGWFWPCEDFCIILKKACSISKNNNNQLHSLTGFAIQYEDGSGSTFFNGVEVPNYVILNPEQITVQDIEKETNIEVKRVKITQYGQERYLMDSNSVLIHEDDWGKLYQKEIAGDEPIVMVKVVNSTPEYDGSFKDYFIRVRPDVKTAHEAVASTFLLTKDQYRPLIET